ncbi:AraC family transcriptional regulator [Thioclava dalianensis]|uniref:AraC family transcriptional regulator n=1 Tax=Thioclava dalianensis TaxID=1185766 RepID=A0A074TH31_9RHOB|nr:helix-turn-helix transcriptional regulator [Thioclava dalianensis]KEP69455.1 AraC family transcriptional regulator [Thioclava dalianensis]SFN69375.1 AraC-type DNA-binding protein [Thioclava dalianensis]
MRDIPIDAVDHIRRPIVAITRDHPDGRQIAPHSHRRGQLISGATGLIVLSTPYGTWVMPPQRGVWIPPGVIHNVQMVGAVRVQSLYIEPDAARGMPDHCQVLEISSFMRGLIVEALDLPLEYDLGGRAGALMTLLGYEIARLPTLPLSLPYPRDDRLAAICRRFMQRPNIHETIDDWSGRLGMSRRAFTRFFRKETGLSFVAWRQQACLLSALPQLATGRPVTAVALDLGYENPAAFTIMFKKAFGAPPLAYLGRRASARV